MKNHLNGLRIQSEFVKNAFTLTIGTSIAQVFPILFYPVLGRIFTPVEFGLLATLTSITAILTVIATGKYEFSILIAKTKIDAANIVGLVIVLSFFFLLFSFIGLLILSNQFNIWFNEPTLSKWLFVCPLSAFSIIIFNCYNEWCVRNKYYVSLSWNKIINSAAITVGKLIFGFVKISSNGLIIGDLLGRVISAAGCVYRSIRRDRLELFQLSFNRMLFLAKRFSEFPKFSMPAQLLNTIGGSFPILLIGVYFNSTEVGYYSMTMNVLSVPLSVLGGAIRDVFRQRAMEDYIKNGECFYIYKKLLKALVFWGILGSILLFFSLPFIFNILLGEAWQIAGVYSQILLPMMAIDFVCTPLSSVLIITEKTKIVLYWQIYYVLITILSLLIGCIIFKEVKICLICFAFGRSTAYLLEILLSYEYSKKNPKYV